jgi:tetratricopeptide (TPR) repeat protein
LSDFNKAIALEPNTPYAYFNRALVFAATGYLDDAEKDIRKYIKLVPNDPDGASLLSRIEAKKKEASAPRQ